MSLSELIGFYSNCSCILENESLELPVVPPKVCVGGLRCPLLGTQSTLNKQSPLSVYIMTLDDGSEVHT